MEKINPVELMLELYGKLGECYEGLSACQTSSYENSASITLKSSCTGQKITLSVSVEDIKNEQK